MKEFENEILDKELASLISLEVDQILQEIKAEETLANMAAEPAPVVEELPVEEAPAEAEETLQEEVPAEDLPTEESIEELPFDEDEDSVLTEEEMEAVRKQVLQELFTVHYRVVH